MTIGNDTKIGKHSAFWQLKDRTKECKKEKWLAKDREKKQ
jgi:hypothetical protein